MKRFVRSLCVVAALVATTGAFAQDKVSFRLNWYLGGLHVPFYYGKERGFYAAEGIDLKINEGRGSANTVQVVAAGSDTFVLTPLPSTQLIVESAAADGQVDTVTFNCQGGQIRA